MLFGDTLTYNGTSSDVYGLSVVTFEDQPQYTIMPQREVQRGEMSGRRRAANHFGVRVSDVLVLTVQLVKNPDMYQGREAEFTQEELSRLAAWLMQPVLPQELVMYYYGRTPRVYYYGLFTSIEPFMVAGRLYGATLTFECSQPYAYTSASYTCTSTTAQPGTIEIMNLSDDLVNPSYPYITVTPTQNGSVVIADVTDQSDKQLTITNCKKNNILYIDCERLIIRDSNGLFKYSDIGIGAADLQNIWWPEIRPGARTFGIIGNANITMDVKYAKKVGDFH